MIADLLYFLVAEIDNLTRDDNSTEMDLSEHTKGFVQLLSYCISDKALKGKDVYDFHIYDWQNFNRWVGKSTITNQ